jgi:hemerythrin superfamily protein
MAQDTAVELQELTKDELYERAQEADIEGRSDMNKDELVRALVEHEQGPDAVDLIISQHDRIRELFSDYRELSDRPSKRKEELVREIITFLSKHAAIEETLFYPAAQKAVPDIEHEIAEDLEEHHLAELALLELDHLPVDADRFDAKVTVLMENIQHHLEEEEQDLLPKIREHMDDEERRRLGTALQEAWLIAPERPHPFAPDHPLIKQLITVPTFVYDRLVNATRTIRERFTE